MSRMEFTAKTKRAAFERAKGVCECHLMAHVFLKIDRNWKPCGMPLADNRIRYEHIDPDAVSHRNDLDNCGALRIECWRVKTDKFDLPMIAGVKRAVDRRRGIERGGGRKLPGGKDSPFKIPIGGGGPICRRTGKPWRP